MTTELSAREAAKALDLRLDYFYKLLEMERIPARKEDGLWRVSANAIEAHRAGKTHEVSLK